MPASDVRPRERVAALAAVAIVQAALGLALLNGLRVEVDRPGEAVERLVEVVLPRTPPPPVPAPKPPLKVARHSSAAPKAQPAVPGGSPGPQRAHALPSVTPVIALRPSRPPSGGGTGSGPAAGAGSGGGIGGEGSGGDHAGGTDLEKISGDILPSDYPRSLGNAGIGGRVSVTFTVQTNGRVANCRVTRSSGIAELDALTCRLMEQRFRFRPSTDRYGRPIAEEVDWDHDWLAR